MNGASDVRGQASRTEAITVQPRYAHSVALRIATRCPPKLPAGLFEQFDAGLIEGGKLSVWNTYSLSR